MIMLPAAPSHNNPSVCNSACWCVPGGRLQLALLGLEQQACVVTSRRCPLCAMQAGAWLRHGPAAAVRHETCSFGARVRSAAAKCYARCSQVAEAGQGLAYTGSSGWP
jgi:hypothetical protein